MKKLLFVFFILFSNSVFSQRTFDLDIWPDGPPNSNHLEGEEIDMVGQYYENVTVPTMRVFLPAPEKSNGMAVLITPGGAYRQVWTYTEGDPWAKWLQEHGIAAMVLKYRMPNGYHEVPMSDAREALNIIQKNKKDWRINSERIGVMGFSAGAHIATTLGTQYSETDKPAFMVLMYPMVAVQENNRDQTLFKNSYKEGLEDYYISWKNVTSETPPSVIFVCQDDMPRLLESSVKLYSALTENKVLSAMYIYPKGGHGFSFNKQWPYLKDTQDLLLKFFKTLNLYPEYLEVE